MKIRVERYSDQHRASWDAFVAHSKNGTFLFCRAYVEYHRERFVDFSLLIYDDRRLIALLPANLDGEILVSHGGLSYGGFVTDARMTTPLMLCVFDAALMFCREQGITGLRYKATPHIYHYLPAEEDLYALFLCGAQLERRSVLTVVGASERIPFQARRQRGVRKARKAGLTVRRADDQLAAYWSLLEATLSERYAARTVHSLDEITYLQQHFPQNIQLYACFEGTAMIAGVLTYESACVARAQYIAANARGRETSALDLLFDHLLHQVFAHKPFFDFGTSHDPATGVIQGGLIDQKEGFGGRAVAQDTYWLDLQNWQPQHILAGAPVKTVSIVVPVYAEAESLPALFDEIRAVEAQLAQRACALELIFVDDGSRDGSFDLLLQFRASRPASKIVKLSRNFGAVAASKAGLRFVTGGCFAWLSADLQDPPALIPEMVDAWLGGAKYVVAARAARHDPVLTQLFARLYYVLLRRFVVPAYPRGGFDLALIDHSLMPHLRDSAHHTNTELLSFWLGVAPVVIPYQRRERLHGKSGWTFARKLSYALDSLLGFSPLLIRAISLIGILVTLLSLLYGAYAILTGAPGFAIPFALIAFLLGVIILALGILGEYLWRIYDQLSQRPEVLIDEVYE